MTASDSFGPLFLSKGIIYESYVFKYTFLVSEWFISAQFSKEKKLSLYFQLSPPPFQLTPSILLRDSFSIQSVYLKIRLRPPFISLHIQFDSETCHVTEVGWVVNITKALSCISLTTNIKNTKPDSYKPSSSWSLAREGLVQALKGSFSQKYQIIYSPSCHFRLKIHKKLFFFNVKSMGSKDVWTSVVNVKDTEKHIRSLKWNKIKTILNFISAAKAKI